jgi:hypothetical protein
MIFRMGAWWGRVRGLLVGEPTPTIRFNAEPQPIDRLIGAMLGASGRITRTEALAVAPVLRARNLICSIATLPLVQRGPGRTVVDDPLLRQIDPDVPNVVTLAQTLEDLLFEGISWWRITASDFAGYPVAARHVDVATVSLNPPVGAVNPLPSGTDPRGAVGDGGRRGVYIDGTFVPAELVIRFDSPNPGLLRSCSKAIHRLALLDAAAELYAKNPRPMDYFTPNPDALEPSDEDRDEFLARWDGMRKRFATGYIPAWVTLVAADNPSPRDLQLVELQARANLDIANSAGIDPEDLGINTTSRTYFNAVDRRQSRVNEVYSPYLRAITDRLSMGDVSRRGYTAAFDLDQYMQADPVTRGQFYAALTAAKAITPEEIRMREGLPDEPIGELPGAEPAPAAAPPAANEPVPAAGEPALQAGHRHLAAVTFDQRPITFALAGPVGAVDRERRTIAGMAMPYGKIGSKIIDGRLVKFRFRNGSILYPADVSRVKHYRDHTSPIGRTLELQSGPAGLAARVSVARGPAGDELLQLAEDGVYDGMSCGLHFSLNPADGDVVLGRDGVYDVVRSTLTEITTTPNPAFDDARVTAVVASREDPIMPCVTCGTVHDPSVACPTATPPPAAPATTAAFTAFQPPTPPGTPPPPAPVPPTTPPPGAEHNALLVAFAQAVAANPTAFGIAAGQLAPPPEVRPTVDPTRPTAVALVNEAAPYAFDRKGNIRRGTHEFSADLKLVEQGDAAANDRVTSWLAVQFDATDTTDTAALNPNRQRPDLYVDQRSYRYPVWDAINKGALADITPFVFPKFNSASGLVGNHTQGTEPTVGDITVTSQTVTPTAISGKAEINREVWDQGGNPQISNLIWRQMVKGWNEALEAAAVALLDAASPTSLGTFTAGGGTTGQTLVSELTGYLASLQFIRGGFSMNNGFGQIDLYKALVGAKDNDGRPLLPALGPTNTNGTVGQRFGAIEVAPGVPLYPAWALAATGSVAASSYLFDSDSVHGWASAPQRLDFNYQVKSVFIGIWGYKATAISDINGVREIIYDPVA